MRKYPDIRTCPKFFRTNGRVRPCPFDTFSPNGHTDPNKNFGRPFSPKKTLNSLSVLLTPLSGNVRRTFGHKIFLGHWTNISRCTNGHMPVLKMFSDKPTCKCIRKFFGHSDKRTNFFRTNGRTDGHICPFDISRAASVIQ